jgi:hypothetical protein
MHSFAFESYGVKFRVDSNRKRALERARSVVTDVLVGQVTEIDPDAAEHRFFVRRTDDNRYLELDGEHLNATPNSRGFHHYFSARVRLLVASHSKEFVFLHAGVIGWKGKCVLFPADSHEGKTTLVAALISRGAVYYSDDYAILDSDGLVHPFPRKLSIRDRERPGKWRDVTAESLEAATGRDPVPIGTVFVTRYSADAKWKPKRLTTGLGLMEIIPFNISLQKNPKNSLNTIGKAIENAIILKSLRPDVKFCINEILEIVDKYTY